LGEVTAISVHVVSNLKLLLGENISGWFLFGSLLRVERRF
jgi:hypothetical protein